MQIWKYELELTDQQIISLPKGAKILTLQTQRKDEGEEPRPFIWAEVNPEAPQEERVFCTLGTGKNIPTAFFEQTDYVGTYQQEPFVWHVYTLKPPPEQQQKK